MSYEIFLVLAVFVVALVCGAIAGREPVEIHAYGGWPYSGSNSSGNQDLSSSNAGDADYTNMSGIITGASP